MSDFYITSADIKTLKTHTNKPNEYKLINVSVSKLEEPPRVDIILDGNLIGSVPYSSRSSVTIIDPKKKHVNIILGIDKPENIDSVPFRYEMKLYEFFGKEFKIDNGNRN